MSKRIEYEMTQEDFDKIIAACQPVPLIALHCGMPRSPQENANSAWEELGKRRGFDFKTVELVREKSNRFFTAITTTAATP